MKIAIIGATGYGGAELVRILRNHPHVTIHSIHASSLYGKPLANSYPHMQTIITDRLQEVNIEQLVDEVDLDLSGDFRIKDQAAYEKWYGMEAADEQLLKNAVYGLTEWIDVDVSEAQLIANPGCYPTGILLGLLPLVKANIIDENSIIIDAKTGVSGAGKGLSAATHFAETNDNFKIYKVNEHQHTPEVEQVLHGWNDNVGAITFSTHLAPMTRGIMATMYMAATEETTTEQLVNL